MALFSTNILLYLLLVLYVAMAIKEKQTRPRGEKEKSEITLGFYNIVNVASVFRIDFIKKILGVFKRIFRARSSSTQSSSSTPIGSMNSRCNSDPIMIKQVC